ncbi:MAG: hypothetical protein AB4042_13010 [Leptolyngbyaceae cyanobacterium]
MMIPILFAPVNSEFFDDAQVGVRDRYQVNVALYCPLDRARAEAPQNSRHMLQLFHHQPGSRAWKRHLTENSCKPGAGGDGVPEALALVQSSFLKGSFIIQNLGFSEKPRL